MLPAAVPTAPAPAEPALICGNCRQAMRRLTLPGHYGRRVELDLCGGCHLVWFDLTETARLTGVALLELIGQMAAAQTLAHEVLRATAGCARCQGALKTVHSRSRWGESLQLECVLRHGAYQTFAAFLREKGLLRPMSHLDRVHLIEKTGRIDCVNCGAAIGARDERCPYCGSVPNLLDVARLAQALDPEGAIEPQAVNGMPARQGAKQCAACGAALAPDQMLACPQCGATLAISRLIQAVACVEALAPALRAHARRPAPGVVKRRLEALDADLPRRREWASNMEAEARQQLGGDDAAESLGWRALLGVGTNPLRAVLLALALWFVWWFW